MSLVCIVFLWRMLEETVCAYKNFMESQTRALYIACQYNRHRLRNTWFHDSYSVTYRQTLMEICTGKTVLPSGGTLQK
jgi:hypothetical protein